MKRMLLLLLLIAGCSSAATDPWQDYLVALQVHDFETKALRQAEAMPAGPKQQEALAKCKQRYERALNHLRECSERVGRLAK